jgi:oligoendopeptidase F
MFNSLTTDPNALITWGWDDFEPYYTALRETPLSAENVNEWLSHWAEIYARGDELYQRLYVAVSVDTSNKEAEQRYITFLDNVFPRLLEAQNDLNQKLLKSSLEPEGFEIALRNIRAEADLYRQENLSLLAEENKLRKAYDKIAGAQTVHWEGEDLTLDQMQPLYQDSDREIREKAWRLASDRQLADRDAFNQVWGKLLRLRRQLADNAGRPDYRAYRWQEMLRFDYTPEDSRRFQEAIEEVVVPSAERVYERRRKRLGLEVLRPWDLDVDVTGQPPLRPFRATGELTGRSSSIFHQVDPILGQYFDQMLAQGLLDLENRKNKAPGGYCTEYMVHRQPFIFMNAVGIHDDVQTLLHEGGHAFHVFEAAALPYPQQRNVPIEFAEVASMGMELLAAPYLVSDQGGFYSPAEAARARIEHLEGIIRFWPYMAVVDAFQHWVYENPDDAQDPARCDAAWVGLWDRFMVGVDWSGLDRAKATGWHRKLHIFHDPFYYIEYGLAQLGAVQVWNNALKDQAGAVARYRQALALGATAALPELFQAAGARFALDASALGEAVSLIERTIQSLEDVSA